ncbi:MAG: hypothetical protein LKF36_08015 [Lactobacillus sp.]|jgi:hypothetical protein|nr:hypothetical protein [Lactobacillus sp.]
MKMKQICFAALLGLILSIGIFTKPGTVSADPSRAQNVYYDYPTTATVVGTWGANLYNGNDNNKVFQRILPNGSQWQVYGYTWRDDGYYYYAGGDLWIQANQVKVPVYTMADAILNVVSRVTGETAKPGWRWVADWWGAGHHITDHVVWQVPNDFDPYEEDHGNYDPAYAEQASKYLNSQNLNIVAQDGGVWFLGAYNVRY